MNRKITRLCGLIGLVGMFTISLMAQEGVLKQSTNSIIYYENDGIQFTFYYPGFYATETFGFGFLEESEYRQKCIPTYDSKGNLIHLKVDRFSIIDPDWPIPHPSDEYFIVYNANNQPLQILRTSCLREESWEDWKVDYLYDAAGEMIFFERLEFNRDTKVWEIQARFEKTNITLEENKPVDHTNQGGFDVSIHIPTDSLANGSLIVKLPEGFTLDEANTNLTVDFAGGFDLTLTKQEDNNWLIEIKSKSSALKNASLRVDKAGKMLHIAYNVDDEVKKGAYDITVHTIQFATPVGNIIPAPAIIVPVSVNRWGVGNEWINDSNAAAYITGNTLYIQTSEAEQITVYTMDGRMLYESAVQAGTTPVDASAFPQGVLIVKGNSDWVKKVVK